MTQLGLRDRARIAWTVRVLDLALSDLPRRRRKGLLRELRANLCDAAAEVGGREAIIGLGSRKELVRSYLAAAGPRSRWKIGLGWVIAAFAVWWFVWLLLQVGFMIGVNSAAAPRDHTYSWQAPWLLGFGGDAAMIGGELLGLGLHFHVFGPLTIFLAAFVLGSSRFWRILPFVGPVHPRSPDPSQ